MKTGEVARMMGINPKTVTNWTEQEEIASYFSESARGERGITQRDYAPEDVLVINTVRLRKTRQNNWGDVAALLATGFRETELPLSAAMTKTISPLDQVNTLMILKAERDTAIAQLQDANAEVERLRTQIETDRDRFERIISEERDRLQQAMTEEHERSLAQVNDSMKNLSELYKLVGRLESQVETMQTELKRLRREE